VHHKLVTLNRYFLQKLSVSKNEPLTNQCLSGFNLAFAHSKVFKNLVKVSSLQSTCESLHYCFSTQLDSQKMKPALQQKKNFIHGPP